MRPLWLCSVALAVALAASLGCSTAQPDCGCVVERGAERKSLACGQSACIAGRVESCSKKAEIIEGSTCSASTPNDETDAGTSTSGPNPTEQQACSDLLTFCNSSCASPPATSTDCQNTANAGDEAACERWQLANGVLCHP